MAGPVAPRAGKSRHRQRPSSAAAGKRGDVRKRERRALRQRPHHHCGVVAGAVAVCHLGKEQGVTNVIDGTVVVVLLLDGLRTASLDGDAIDGPFMLIPPLRCSGGSARKPSLSAPDDTQQVSWCHGGALYCTVRNKSYHAADHDGHQRVSVWSPSRPAISTHAANRGASGEGLTWHIHCSSE
jgi:hypothetical protein